MASLTCETCPVRDRAACAALDDDERDELARLGSHRTLARGETLFAAGDDNAICATLISGALKISSFDEDGTEHILSLVHPAGFVGEMFAPLARHDVIALTDSRLCLFTRDRYEAAATRFPALGQALLRRASEDVFESRALIARMASTGTIRPSTARRSYCSSSRCKLASVVTVPLVPSRRSAAPEWLSRVGAMRSANPAKLSATVRRIRA